MNASAMKGYTLVEALITLSVIMILSSLAIPAMNDMLGLAYREAITNEAVSALRHTRSEAIKRNDQVVLCKASGASLCNTEGSWEQGWLAFHDANGNGRQEADEAVVLRREKLPPGWRLTGNLPLANYVAYQSMGNTRLVTGGFQAGTLTLCKASAKPTTAVRIVINSMGRPRTERVQVASC